MEFSFTLDAGDIEDSIIATLVARRATSSPRGPAARVLDWITGIASLAFLLALVAVIAYSTPIMAAVLAIVVIAIGLTAWFRRRLLRRPVRVRVLAERFFKQLPEAELTRTARIDESGVHVTSQASSTSRSWSEVFSAVETKRCFVLVVRANTPAGLRRRWLARRTKGRASSVIPKRALLQQEKAELRVLIEKHLHQPILDIRL